MKCPKDGCDFESTERGVKVHHTKSHGESLCTITCDNCGEEFYKKPHRQERSEADYCSPECNIEDKTIRLDKDELHHQYYVQKKSTEDVGKYFGVGYSVVIREMERYGMERRTGATGELNGNYNKTGEQHPSWKGGNSVRGTKEYNEAMKACYERDDYTCQDCGERGGHKTPHHIERVSDAPEKADELDNLVLLCPECHAQRHAEVEEWSAVNAIKSTFPERFERS